MKEKYPAPLWNRTKIYTKVLHNRLVFTNKKYFAADTRLFYSPEKIIPVIFAPMYIFLGLL
ncbi:MAG: hypothetical protein D3905_08530 [Candidatus Electrothrix sp. AS4_5]|nr:hypothetical protein [Candidatus Electrothrix gigas]